MYFIRMFKSNTRLHYRYIGWPVYLHIHSYPQTKFINEILLFFYSFFLLILCFGLINFHLLCSCIVVCLFFSTARTKMHCANDGWLYKQIIYNIGRQKLKEDLLSGCRIFFRVYDVYIYNIMHVNGILFKSVVAINFYGLFFLKVYT